MADWMWWLATSYTALSIIGLVALAALIVGHVPFGKYAPIMGPYVILGRFVAYPTLMLFAFLVGVRITDERAALKQAKIDLAFSELQLNTQKQAAADAAKLRAEAEAKTEQANQKVTEYEAELAKRHDADGCNLDAGDVDSLRGIAR